VGPGFPRAVKPNAQHTHTHTHTHYTFSLAVACAVCLSHPLALSLSFSLSCPLSPPRPPPSLSLSLFLPFSISLSLSLSLYLSPSLSAIPDPRQVGPGFPIAVKPNDSSSMSGTVWSKVCVGRQNFLYIFVLHGIMLIFVHPRFCLRCV